MKQISVKSGFSSQFLYFYKQYNLPMTQEGIIEAIFSSLILPIFLKNSPMLWGME